MWLLDLCTSKKEHVQQKVFTCHAGPIVDMDIADWGPFVATLDKNGNLHIYNYIKKELSLIHKFYDTSRQVIWFPCKVNYFFLFVNDLYKYYFIEMFRLKKRVQHLCALLKMVLLE